MGQFKAKTVNTNRAWSNTLRLKVNETVEHLGSLYQSLTGVNTEPGTDNNWIHVGISDNSSIVHKTGNETISGVKSFNSSVILNSGEIQFVDSPNDNASIIYQNDALEFYKGSEFLGAINIGGLFFRSIVNAFNGKLKGTLFTANREFEFPDSNGTVALESYVDDSTGWEAVVDTLHTVGSPQTVAQGVTATLTNNKGTIFNTQLPSGVTTFFDSATSKITPQNENDFMTSSFMFKAKNSNIDGVFTIYIDIPSLGERFSSVHMFPKGANTEHGFDIDICHFISNQFAINGGIIKIVANVGDLEIYDKQFRFCRVHRSN